MSQKLLPKDVASEMASHSAKVRELAGRLEQMLERYDTNEREFLAARLSEDTLRRSWVSHFEVEQSRIEWDLEHVIPELHDLLAKLDGLVKTDKQLRRYSRPIVDAVS